VVVLVALSAFIVDQVLKFVLLRFAPEYTFLSTRTLIFSNSQATVISIIFLILLFGLYLRDKGLLRGSFEGSLGIGLCFGGAFSNLLDRLWREGVLDISFGWFHTNLADVMVLVGLILLFWFYFSTSQRASLK